MKTGVIKWFNSTKGYGFITFTDDNGKYFDVLVHYSAIETDGFKALCEGQAVTFELIDGPKGKIATNVYKVKDTM